MKMFRVIKRRKAVSPVRWGVQKLDGYTNGRPSWRLATRQAFFTKAAAEAFIAASAETAGTGTA